MRLCPLLDVYLLKWDLKCQKTVLTWVTSLYASFTLQHMKTRKISPSSPRLHTVRFKVECYFFCAYQSQLITDNLNELNVCIIYSLVLGLNYANSFFHQDNEQKFSGKAALNWIQKKNGSPCCSQKKKTSFHIAGY